MFYISFEDWMFGVFGPGFWGPRFWALKFLGTGFWVSVPGSRLCLPRLDLSIHQQSSKFFLFVFPQ